MGHSLLQFPADAHPKRLASVGTGCMEAAQRGFAFQRSLPATPTRALQAAVGSLGGGTQRGTCGRSTGLSTGPEPLQPKCTNPITRTNLSKLHDPCCHFEAAHISIFYPFSVKTLDERVPLSLMHSGLKAKQQHEVLQCGSP